MIRPTFYCSITIPLSISYQLLLTSVPCAYLTRVRPRRFALHDRRERGEQRMSSGSETIVRVSPRFHRNAGLDWSGWAQPSYYVQTLDVQDSSFLSTIAVEKKVFHLLDHPTPCHLIQFRLVSDIPLRTPSSPADTSRSHSNPSR